MCNREWAKQEMRMGGLFSQIVYFFLTIHMYTVGDRSDQGLAHKYLKQSKSVEEEER